MCAFHSQIHIHLSDSLSVGAVISEWMLLEKEWYRYGIDPLNPQPMAFVGKWQMGSVCEMFYPGSLEIHGSINTCLQNSKKRTNKYESLQFRGSKVKAVSIKKA